MSVQGLVRDNSGFLINTNDIEYTRILSDRQNQREFKQTKNELEYLKNELNGIKQLLMQKAENNDRCDS